MANDPNKYKKNANIKPDTLMHTITSVGSMLLMFVGIIGLAMEFFKENGLIGKIFGWLFDSTTHMAFIPFIILILWLLNRWISTPGKDETKKSGNLPMYFMMGIGIYYIYRLLKTGGF
jgi:hypothetical protein